MAAFILTVALVPASSANVLDPLGSEQDAGLWTPSGQLTAVAPHVGTSGSQTDFGASVAVDGGTAVVGTPYEDTAYVYEKEAAVWIESDILEGPAGFGETVAIQDDTIAVGAPADSSVLVFARAGATWELDTALTVPGTSCLGVSIALQEDLLAVGDACGSKAVYVFEPGASTWVRTGELAVPGDDDFGESVDVGEDVLIVGGDAMYAFHRLGADRWSKAETVTPHVGREVVTSGSLAATVTDGRIVVFELREEAWQQVAELAPEDLSLFETLSDRFGWSLALEDGILVAGAYKAAAGPGVVDSKPVLPRHCESAGGFSACLPQTPGAAYVYERSENGWAQTAKLTSEVTSGEKFGYSVAVDAQTGTILAGAPGHPYATYPVGVDTSDAVHVFSRSGVGILP